MEKKRKVDVEMGVENANWRGPGALVASERDVGGMGRYRRVEFHAFFSSFAGDKAEICDGM